MARNKKSSGCSTWFWGFMGFSAIFYLFEEYWKIILVIAFSILLIMSIYYLVSPNQFKRQVASGNKKIKGAYKNIKNAKSQRLYGGNYISGRDIPHGIYDIKVIDGCGVVKLSSSENLFLNKNEVFCNIELPSQSKMLIPAGMTVDLYNRRELPEPIPEPISEPIPEPKIPELPISQSTSRKTFSMKDIDRMDGHDFEYLCADILRAKGYENVTVTRGSGDQGVDVLAEHSGIKYAVQCKRFSGSVGNKAVQEVHFGKTYYHCHVAIVMTNSYFTPSAKDAANESNTILWDRDDLMPYFEEYIKNKNPEQEVSPQPLETEETQNNIVENSSEEAIHYSVLPEYDMKSGIYPAGYYAIGKTLPKGGYVFKSRGDDEGVIAIFETSDDLSKEENDVFFHSFTGSYFLALIDDNKFIAIENADAQRVYGVN